MPQPDAEERAAAPGHPSLEELGWRSAFAQQLVLEDLEAASPARVMGVARSVLRLASAAGEATTTLPVDWQQQAPEQRPTVGDWLMLAQATGEPVKLLDRQSLFKRKAAGERAAVQLIAANVDTLFVVTSCNADFNPSRLERYLALALNSGVEPVVVITKADTVAEPGRYIEAAQALRAGLPVVAVNAKQTEALDPLSPWCRPGRTVALVGSSGVGKSTLLNSLAGHSLALTGAIREDDSKGRHTTTSRALHWLPGRGLILDSPGMRELKLTEVSDGLAEVFADIDELATQCRFGDCQHASEPGCAVQAAIGAGRLQPRRLENYLKLAREEAYNNESIAEQRRRGRTFNQAVRARQALYDKRRKN